MSLLQQSALIFVLTAASAHARAASAANGVALDELMALGAAPIAALMERARIEPETQPARAPRVARAALSAGVSIDRLMADGAMTFDEIVSGSARPSSRPVTAPALASTVVTVTIPDTPDAEPVAVLAGDVGANLSAKAAPKPSVAAAPESAEFAYDGAPKSAESASEATLKSVALASKGAPKHNVLASQGESSPKAFASPAGSKAVTPGAAPRLELLPPRRTLEISDGGDALAFRPQALVLEGPGTTVKVLLKGAGFEALTVFVRDQSVASFDQKAMELTAQRRGHTEVYAVMRGKMYIVPVTVEGEGSPKLLVPDALVSLDGVFRGGLGSALYPGLEQASRQPQSGTRAADGPSLQESQAETARTAREVEAEGQRYDVTSAETSFKPFTIQVIDDRSAPALGRVYPVPNATVRIAGTEYVAKTDATGHLTIRDMPVGSRFLLNIDDGTGVFRSAIAEMSTRTAQADRVARLKVIRTFAFDAYASIAGVAQHAAYGSYCATIWGEADGARVPVEGIAAAVDTQAEGPFYFNRFGFLDRALRATGPDGRVCYYNVAPGPLAMSLYEDGALVATLPMAAFAGRHGEDDLSITSSTRLTARLATMATAHEQLGSDMRAANSLKTIDMIDLIPLGTGAPMMQLAPGRVTATDLAPYNGRLSVFAQAAEFEPAVYSFAGEAREGVVPLMPRGMIEDLSVYAQVAYDPALGVVLVEFGHGVDAESVTVRLVDAEGQDVGDGWYFSDQPVTKAVFFNVPAGAYAILVETRDGVWLGGETTTVYNETVSYARLGGQIRYRP